MVAGAATGCIGFTREADLVIMLFPRITIFVSPLALRDLSSSTNTLCLACSALVLSTDT